ncbi:quinone-dependent dihydroorotate dehydrogenase [Candidatus Uhrbacteria bacterium]|nr:quinone-dependent dihydroorotate dehydrogenase [Candidatus Uhrbacteria bacterium]
MIRTVARATQWWYERAVKPVLFRWDPETVHDHALQFGAWIGAHPRLREMVAHGYAYHHPALTQELAGITFPAPIGLAAGFDKNARLLEILPAVGFGFAEIGSVTAVPCAGNPKPRLWRLPESGALQVYYGLANDGAAIIAERLRRRALCIPIGVSVAKTNAPSTAARAAGIADMVAGMRAVQGVGSYCTLNVSCPNAFGGTPFSDDSDALDELLQETDALRSAVPVFLKLPCDSTAEEFDALLAVADRHAVAGVIISNLTKDPQYPGIAVADRARLQRGGISGKPVAQRANAHIARTYARYRDRFVIVGCGGVFTVDDAYEKIRCGASLVQLITGMIYQGPSLIGQLHRGLVERLHREGFASIRDAVGSGVAGIHSSS